MRRDKLGLLSSMMDSFMNAGKYDQSLPATEVPDSGIRRKENTFFVDDTDVSDVCGPPSMQAGRGAAL